MDSNATVIGGIITSLCAAIGWLGKRLYDAPRKEDFDAIKKERDELRKIVDDASEEVKKLAAQRDEENKKLRDEISALRISVERRASGEGGEGSAVLTRRRRRPTR